MAWAVGSAVKAISPLNTIYYRRRRYRRYRYCLDFAPLWPWTQQRVPAFARHRATNNKGKTSMRKAILGTASALALASPAVAADVPVTPYTGGPTYEREVPYEYYRSAPPVVVAQPAPVVVVRRPVIVAPPPVVVDEYPVYAAPRVYAASPVYAYAGPVWRDGWGHRRHFRGRW
jgi:hypothetical protein